MLAGDERVERQPVGDVAGAVDDRVPQALVLRVARLRVGARGERLGARDDLGALGGVARSAARRAASAPTQARSSSAARSTPSSGGTSPWAASASSRSRPPSRRQSRTRVAPPWLIRIRPDSCSRLSASRTAWRLAPSCSDSRRSDGTAAPGGARRRGSRRAAGRGCDRTGALVGPVGWTGCTRLCAPRARRTVLSFLAPQDSERRDRRDRAGPASARLQASRPGRRAGLARPVPRQPGRPVLLSQGQHGRLHGAGVRDQRPPRRLRGRRRGRARRLARPGEGDQEVRATSSR